jgi:hypothetical protein
MGFVVDKVALGQVFSEYVGFPCKFLFHRLLHIHHHLSSGAGTIGQLVADVPSGLSLTPHQEIKKGDRFVRCGSFRETCLYRDSDSDLLHPAVLIRAIDSIRAQIVGKNYFTLLFLW